MKKKNKWQIAATTIIISAGILTAGYLYWCDSLKDQVIWTDININGISLKGKSKKEAENAIQNQFKKEYQTAAVDITLAGKTYTAKIFPLLSLDASEEIRSSYQPGHGKWYARGIDWLKIQKQEPISTEILPEITYPEKLRKILEETGIDKLNTMTETTWDREKTSLTIHKGKTGVRADMEELEKDILETLSHHEYEINLECPEIRIFPKEIILQPFYNQIHVEMSNAFLDKNNAFSIVPSVQGVSFDVKKAEKQMEETEEGTDLKIDFTITEPELSTEELKSMLYRDILGEYTTYGGGSSSRVTNIQLACEHCNDVILNPGETFSYNETVGERTSERGFQSAPVIANGQLVPGIGGGICQVSTTLYAACLNAGLEIVERHPHSKPVAYVPHGMDAAVSWGTLDYQFRNNTDYPVKIKTFYENDAITAQILGTYNKSAI